MTGSMNESSFFEDIFFFKKNSSFSPPDCAHGPEGAARLRPGGGAVRLHAVLREPQGDGRLPLLEIWLLGQPPGGTQVPHQVGSHGNDTGRTRASSFHLLRASQRPLRGGLEEVQEDRGRRSAQRTISGAEPRSEQPVQPGPGPSTFNYTLKLPDALMNALKRSSPFRICPTT